MAAPQVGELKRIVVIRSGFDNIKNYYPKYLVNPIISEEYGKSRYKEGCLSVPGVYAYVNRCNQFLLDYQDLDGTIHHIEITNVQKDFFGTVVMHEIDHLNGIEFIDRLDPIEKNKISKKLNKLRKRK